MCELLAISSQLPTQTGFSLEKLASHSRYEGDGKYSSRDGWGVAYYEGKDITLLREPQAAIDSQLVQFIEQHIPPTQLLISHIRKATQGNRALCNTQPFARELGGCIHVFAHNGDVTGIQNHTDFIADCFHPVGGTDSEHAFCYLMDKLTPLWKNKHQTKPLLRDRFEVVCAFAKQLRQFGPANFLYSDSDVLFAHAHKRRQENGEIKPPGLFMLNRQSNGESQQAFNQHGLSMSQAPTHLQHEQQEVAIVASVPLTDENWHPLEEGEVLVLLKGKQIDCSSFK